MKATLLRPVPAVAPLALLCLVLCGGCGKGEYEARMKKTLTVLKSQADFQSYLYAPITLPGTTITLRVPRLFTTSINQVGPGIMEDDLHTPFLKFRGYKLTYIAELKNEKGETLPVYCYLAAVVKAQEEPLGEKPLAQRYEDSLKKSFAGKVGVQQTSVASAAYGTPEKQWKKISVTGAPQRAR